MFLRDSTVRGSQVTTLKSMRLSWCLLWTVVFSVACSGRSIAGDFFGHAIGSIAGGYRWDAAPRTIGGNERSLDGGLRYSLQGGSYQAYRDSFNWGGNTPSVSAFQLAIEQAFGAWTSVDPVSGLGSNLSFVADLTTPVAGTGSFSGVNLNGAEIDLFALNSGSTGVHAVTWFNGVSAPNLQLTSGTMNYGGFAIGGADITLNNNPNAVYSLDLFRRLLTHEIGHAIGLGDVENAYGNLEFLDDNFDPTSNATMLATLINPWAHLINVYNPAGSPLSLYSVPADAFTILGVDILMESNGLGIGGTNPVTSIVPLRNDDYGTRQFLYPYVVPEPSAGLLLLTATVTLMGRRRRGSSRNPSPTTS